MIDGEMWQMPTPMRQSRTNATGSFRIGGKKTLDVGISKPDPRIFHIALERAQVKPHEAVYVGDHPLFRILTRPSTQGGTDANTEFSQQT